MLYSILEYIHIFAAIVMVGISLANGFGKLFADRTKNIHRIALVMALTVIFNKILVFPSLVLLALSGVSLAALGRLPIFKSWVSQAIILFVVLFILFFVGNHYESKLLRIAEGSEKEGIEAIPDGYWKITTIYNLVGAPVIIVILSILYLMIFQTALF